MRSPRTTTREKPLKSDEDPVQSKDKHLKKRETEQVEQSFSKPEKLFKDTEDCKRTKDERGEHWTETLT